MPSSRQPNLPHNLLQPNPLLHRSHVPARERIAGQRVREPGFGSRLRRNELFQRLRQETELAAGGFPSYVHHQGVAELQPIFLHSAVNHALNVICQATRLYERSLIPR